MTQPRLATQTEHGRMYARADGGEPEVPSITTVIGQQATDLGGWHGYMAAKAVLEDDRALRAGRSAGLRHAVIRDAALAAERYRDQAAARGDRVHAYCEAVALRAMGREHDVDGAREALMLHQETAWADRFDEWWEAYRPEPLAPEITVWNRTVGYAGTLDLVARIGGRVCIIDYKTKGTDRKGRVKPLDEKVIMQLVAGVKAEESLVDPAAGTWEPWAYGDAPVLLGVSRKRFIGTLAGVDQPDRRDPGTLALTLAAVAQGIQIHRIHDVAPVRQGLSLWQALEEGPET